MRPKFTASRMAADLIMAFEGFRPNAVQVADGRWMVGYGHTRSTRPHARITEADAEALLAYDLTHVARLVNEHVYAPINQNQFDALAAFTFNIGQEAFLTSPTLRRLNEGRPLEAAAAMELFRKADFDGDRIVVDALVRRRAAEKALFLKPTDGWSEASTPLLPPRIDYDLMALIPLTSSVAARASIDGDRIYAEREPHAEAGAYEPGEAPLATEAAAAAVIERLEALFAEPSHAAPAHGQAAPRAREPEPAPHHPAPAGGETLVSGPEFVERDEETEEVETVETVAATREALAAEPEPRMPHPDRALFSHVQLTTTPGRRSRQSWFWPLGVLALGAAGAGLLALAAYWGIQVDYDQVLGVSPKTAGLTTGFIGVIALGLSAYFVLERLGLPKSQR